MASNIGEVVLTPMKVSVLIETQQNGAFVKTDVDAIEHLMPRSFQKRTYAVPKDGSRITVLSRRMEWQPDVSSNEDQTFKMGPKAAPVVVTYARVSDETVHLSFERKYA